MLQKTTKQGFEGSPQPYLMDQGSHGEKQGQGQARQCQRVQWTSSLSEDDVDNTARIVAATDNEKAP